VGEQGKRRHTRGHGSERLEHAGEDLEAEVLFVAQAVGTTLDDTDLVVESLDEAERWAGSIVVAPGGSS
jgi:hypothetical protein